MGVTNWLLFGFSAALSFFPTNIFLGACKILCLNYAHIHKSWSVTLPVVCSLVSFKWLLVCKFRLTLMCGVLLYTENLRSLWKRSKFSLHPKWHRWIRTSLRCWTWCPCNTCSNMGWPVVTLEKLTLKAPFLILQVVRWITEPQTKLDSSDRDWLSCLPHNWEGSLTVQLYAWGLINLNSSSWHYWSSAVGIQEHEDL